MGYNREMLQKNLACSTCCRRFLTDITNALLSPTQPVGRKQTRGKLAMDVLQSIASSAMQPPANP
ncbi:hypothetical protein PGTUg99_004368 [Puccinia graminis f. sp. tritici]|uniref:Uncharacterized protein n=1 Tax=Puccinia graminis f. sp. tritici TaxID=56615 RepID=A0A5B0RZG1_PUCGR|nr:hypothetical protein PGTUg99_004368 [Puccinia graminis f. sp. tritici]